MSKLTMSTPRPRQDWRYSMHKLIASIVLAIVILLAILQFGPSLLFR
ncbi:MAG: hypothetical protein GY844_32630 [Bradyrhizobium sp.]|nr:hypothetical protein [Bradyrhizobium sp.]